MKNLISLILMFVAAFALPSKQIRSANLVPKGRIAGGHDATDLQFPYQAALTIDETNEGFNLCGGTVLNNEWILTAAHCVRNHSSINVILGAIDIKYPEMQYNVGNESIIIHEDFIAETYENDVALIRIPFTNYTDRIKPVKLPDISQSNYLYRGQHVIASGFGNINDLPTSFTEKLHWVSLEIMVNLLCDEYFEIRIISSQLCTANFDGKNICYGDSGGPLVLKTDQTLIGIISFSGKNCLGGYPGVHTRVGIFLEWIKKFTGI